MQIVTKADQLFLQGNLHLKSKLRYLGCQSQKILRYILNRLRKYRGNFFESNKLIAQNTETCVKTVQNCLKRCEQLGIFLISNRYEDTFNGKKRQTTNRIQLLSYEPIEVVKKITEKVRTIACELVRKVTKPNTHKSNKNAPRQRYTRTEVVPEWLNQPEEVILPTQEEQLAFDALQQRLREKYQKGKT